MATATTAQKDSHLRHAEYYDLTEVFDDLYARSKAQAVFTDLMPLILSEENPVGVQKYQAQYGKPHCRRRPPHDEAY